MWAPRRVTIPLKAHTIHTNLPASFLTEALQRLFVAFYKVKALILLCLALFLALATKDKHAFAVFYIWFVTIKRHFVFVWKGFITHFSGKFKFIKNQIAHFQAFKQILKCKNTHKAHFQKKLNKAKSSKYTLTKD